MRPPLRIAARRRIKHLVSFASGRVGRVVPTSRLCGPRPATRRSPPLDDLSSPLGDQRREHAPRLEVVDALRRTDLGRRDPRRAAGGEVAAQIVVPADRPVEILRGGDGHGAQRRPADRESQREVHLRESTAPCLLFRAFVQGESARTPSPGAAGPSVPSPVYATNVRSHASRRLDDLSSTSPGGARDDVELMPEGDVLGRQVLRLRERAP